MAVAAVLLFHLQLGYASGGFLGVSLFFTLSGYLITHLLLEEHRRYGEISLWKFWARRFRRLMPGALLALSLVVLFTFVRDLLAYNRLRGDLWA
jgi:peptidoglycan/LPS O-acetylase OafA/YrhL